MHSMKFTTTLTLGIAALLIAATPAAVGDKNKNPKHLKHPAIAVPAEIDFGRHRVSETVPGRVWLINRSTEMLQLTKVKGDCGCIRLHDFEPVELAPRTTLPIDFTYAAPKEDGKGKTKTLTFMFEDHESLQVELTIAADADAGAALDEAHPLPSGVIAAPGALAFGEVEASSIVNGQAWLINTGDEPMVIVSAKGDCGCITLKDFEPMTLGANEARLVSFAIKTPDTAGKKKKTKITFMVADADSITLPISMNAVEAKVARAGATPN